MRLSIVGYVVITSGPSATFLLVRIADTLHIAEIIIRPDESYILGNLQSRIIYLEYLLIRGE